MPADEPTVIKTVADHAETITGGLIGVLGAIGLWWRTRTAKRRERDQAVSRALEALLDEAKAGRATASAQRDAHTEAVTRAITVLTEEIRELRRETAVHGSQVQTLLSLASRHRD
jgi:TPP-dependent trihydroxycyclohexane-1,2-dione (THcHDO) dehydratase